MATETPEHVAETHHDTVIVVDFGAQYAQLIARRVREAKVFSEIMPHTATSEEILAKNPKAVILSGGPSSVYEEGAPQLPVGLVDSGTAVFGICYGFMAMAKALGGEVARTGQREYGRTKVSVLEPGTLLKGLPESLVSWMSHGDEVVREPVTDGGTAGRGDLGDDEVEVAVHEERPVIDKDVVATEEVGVQRNTVTDERDVTTDVAHEEVDVVQDDDREGLRDDRR